MTELFMEKEQFEKKPETGGHTTCERGQVARSHSLTVPPRSVRASSIDSASPSGYVLIYPENLHPQEDRPIREAERHHHHDLRFRSQIDPALHAGEGDFEGIFTASIINTISTNHVLVPHHHV